MNTKIIVCCHKKDLWKSDNVYLPVQVGKAITDLDLGIQGDNTGENISHKNKSYCELTGIYWAWKNLKNVDYIGVCHYRRYFKFKGMKTLFSDFKLIKDLKTIDIQIPDLTKTFKKYDIVLARPKIYPYSLFVDYSVQHYSEDLRKVESIIFEKYPDYIKAYKERISNSNRLSHYNMFIMKWQDFNDYCTWLFSILEIAENKIDVSNYNDTQKRIWGYISERLLMLYVYHNKMKTKYYPIYWINNEIKKISLLKKMQQHIRTNISFNIIKKRYNDNV